MLVDAIDGATHAPALLSPALDRADAAGLDGVANNEVNKNGISNCVRCRIGDGAVRFAHRTMLKRSRMAIAFFDSEARR